jgi:protein involved in polysaccharide export with SLBB domain
MHPTRGSVGVRAAALVAALLLAGCAANQVRLEKALLSDRNPAAHSPTALNHYVIECPDQLAVELAGGWSVQGPVQADGRIALPDSPPVRVAGQTLGDAARSIARALRVPANRVRVRVLEFRSQQIFVYGEVGGVQRAVAYRGPETVLEVLQRVGGISPGAAPGNIQVLRGNIADGKAPEVFPIDLEAIVLKNDQQTNIRVEPFDQIYIGESRRGVVEKCLPPWLRPLYQRLTGMSRPSGKPAPQPTPGVGIPAPPTPPGPSPLPAPRIEDRR